MNNSFVSPGLLTPCQSLSFAGFLLFSGIVLAQDVQHLSVRQKGGMPGLPVMSGINTDGTNVTVQWDGPAGYYQLVKRSGLLSASWESASPLSLARVATVTLEQSNLFFRVIGPAPHYAGQQVCATCHPQIHEREMTTRHAGALDTLRQVGEQNNPACLPCHTVGYGLPTGFISENATPNLGGVQCENCHGPAGNHAADENDPVARPRVELAATVCGGCHEAESHRPHFEDWSSSGHGMVTRENMNAISCGRCHIGSARIALVKDEPVPQNDRNLPVTCVVCHDPHGRHVFTNSIAGLVYTNQVRNPLHSTNDFFLTTSDVFTNKYDPNIQVCAQCHNHRGADWTSTSGPPHHSPQYNMLLGTVGVIPAGVTAENNRVHAGLEFSTSQAGQPITVTNQCVTCHMQTREHQSGTPEMLAVTGHKFTFGSFDACAACHAFPEELFTFATNVISDRMQLLKKNLDLWATTKAPDQLRTNYGSLSWEYTRAGDLSEGNGPSTSDQMLIPSNIKKARFNLYLVLYDGSYGIHNTPHTLTLLNAADNWVRQELNIPAMEQATDLTSRNLARSRN